MSSPRKNLLFLAQTLPYPPHGGVSIRTYNILRILSRRYNVHLVCFYRKKTTSNIAQSIHALERVVASVRVFPIKQEYSWPRFLRDHARSLISRRAYTYYAYENVQAERTLVQLRDELSPCIVHLDSLDLSRYLNVFCCFPVTVTHHNVESKLLKRRIERTKSKFQQMYFRVQSELMRQEERRFVPKVALNLMCSSADDFDLVSISGGGNTIVVPNGVDVDYFRPQHATQSSIISVGGTTWFPNLDAVEHTANDILPIVRNSIPDSRVVWVGRSSDHQKTHYRGMGVDLIGYVDDVRPYVSAAKCFIAPLRVGGGTRLKILDAWAMGKAVVSTSVGCEGLEAVDGENILVRDEPEAFAAAVVAVMRNDQLRSRLETNARATAENLYSWEIISDRILGAYADIERGS